MNCPKCNNAITEEMLVCPNCKKVLKLVCPKCNTINKNNTCKKCGFVIISKCHQCGKINPTINGKCSKCGFNTYTSVAITSSNIDEFACLTIEFPNLSDIKSALGSTKLAEKFKSNLDRLILNYVAESDLNREIIDKVYIVRFNKDESFQKSAESAIKAAIDILNLVTELNFKLDKLKSVTLDCKMAVLKRDINSKPDEYKSGFDIKLINQDKKGSKLLKNLQVITDSYVYEQICENYNLNSLSASFVKNEMIMFFELNLKKYVKIPIPPKKEKEPESLAKLNIFEEEDLLEKEAKNELYNVDAINFNELKSSFVNIKSANLISEIISLFKKNKKRIVSVKGEKEFQPKTGEIIEELMNAGVFKNIVHITCYDEMRYKPYGFFYELISNLNNFAKSPKNFAGNNYTSFKQIDASGFIKDMINLNERKFPHPEDVRYSLFDIFFEILQPLSNTLIYIENFDKIDDTSHEVLQLLFEKFDTMNLSYMVSTNKVYPVHKKSHFLLANPSYIEIQSVPTPLKEIIGERLNNYEKILDSFYIKQIAQNVKGSVLYFNNAIDYLLEKNLLKVEESKYSIANFENVFIPVTLEELVTRRLKYLEDENEEAYKLFGMLLLIGPVIDLPTINLLGSDVSKLLQKLFEKGYIYPLVNAFYIQNYNLHRESFFLEISPDLKQLIAKEVSQKVFASLIPHPMDATLYNILDMEKQEFMTWERLSSLNASMGDFSAYLHCSIKFLKLLENQVSENSEKTIEEYKLEVYENISNLLYKYTPNEIYNITQIILNNLEKTTDDKKVISLCNKMLQGCLIGGNYSYALELVHKILSRFHDASINPADSNFNISFFMVSLIKVEIMFSIGNFRGCVDSGTEILDVLTPQNIPNLKPQHLSAKQFEDIILDAMSFVAVSKVILLQGQSELEEFKAKMKNNIGCVPEVFNSFLLLEKVIKGNKVSISENISTNDDKFSKILQNIIKAFSVNKDDYKKFADNIYQAKISAKMNSLSQIELMCDLLIGYSYAKLKQYKKAQTIYQNVLETSIKNGLKMVTYLDWYLISVLKFEQQDFEIALGLANNAIVQLEKDSNVGDFLFFLFRVVLYKIFISQNNNESAELCLNNAKFIKDKYGLNFKIEKNSVQDVQTEENIGEIS